MTDKETMQVALEALRVALARPERKPLTDYELRGLLLGIDPQTKRLPMGFKQFARAIEAAHGIKEPDEA